MGADAGHALTVGAWLTIDAVLDNEVSNLIRGGYELDNPAVVRPHGLRERGWAVSGAHPQPGA